MDKIGGGLEALCTLFVFERASESVVVQPVHYLGYLQLPVRSLDCVRILAGDDLGDISLVASRKQPGFRAKQVTASTTQFLKGPVQKPLSTSPGCFK